jgi:formylglycine-generating enzyme required for sulfatase activity
MPFLPGELLNQRYRLVSLLGRGAYGCVYRAWDVQEQVDVAIKEFLDPTVEIQRLFRREARRLAALQHPQLPAIRDHFALEDTGQYLVSDYIDGVDLQSLVDQFGPLPSDMLIGWLQAAAEPLHYLHQQGYRHLNVKPANIRLTPAGEVFLVDTGLPGLGIMPARGGYGSPEQQAQGEITAAADIYSLGATLYTLLTGREPPKALERESGLVDLLPAREVNPNVEPYLSIVAGRAMSLRPDTRYESALEFAQALNRPAGRPVTTVETLRRSEPLPSVPPPPRRPVNRRKRFEQRTIYALVILLLVIVAATVVIAQVDFPGVGITEEEATATTQSQVIAALTAVAPTLTPTPDPTFIPTATPEPLLTETGMRMLFMPGSIFRMGDEEGEADERPSRQVRLDPYYIDETEVTNGQYQLCVAAEVCEPPDSPNATFHPAYYGDPAYADYPVLFVTWYKAETYCAWRGARLPSEAEWEKAAGFDPQQAVKYRYPWGDTFNGSRLNYCDVNCNQGQRDITVDDEHRDTAPVGSFPTGRSPIGAYDLLGNVMEWVSDWYDRDYYQEGPDSNPLGPPEGEFKVLRGGSWLSGVDDLGVVVRTFYDPRVSRANIGFRCAMAVP